MNNVRRLRPLIHQDKRPYTTDIPQNLQTLADCLRDFSQQIRFLSKDISEIRKDVRNESYESKSYFTINSEKKIYEEKQSFEGINGKQEFRFQNVHIIIPRINTSDEAQKNQAIQEWLGMVCKKIFSVSFCAMEGGKLSQKTCKSYCSEQLLVNIVQFIKKNSLNTQELKLINETLKDKLLPYFGLKYPQSQSLEVSLGFANTISQINNLQDNQNDLIFRSGIKFQFNKSGNYNSSIMKFLNYLIQLPDRNILSIQKNIDSKPLSIFANFYADMQQLFKKTENHIQMLKMKKFEPKFPEKQLDFQEIQRNFSQTQKEKQKYREHVKTYTNYLIGRKLSENIQKFSLKDINSGNLNLINPALIRIVTKWCEQLRKYFNADYIINRQQQFRMKDRSEKFLDKKHMKILSLIMEKQRTGIEQYLQEILQNNYENQAVFSKLKIKDSLKLYSQQDATMGQFISVMFMNNQNYLVAYLNKLIHGITQGLKDFQQIVKVQRFSNYDQNFSDKINKVITGELQINQLIAQSYQKDMEVDQDYTNQMVPDLISFKIGDILRCKCSSKDNQIIALYNQIQRISHKNPSLLKIVRVKNRLNKGSKDILVNLLYRDQLLVQMQLAIKSEKSRFIDCSSKFSHYIYELQRAQFGPILQMCSILISLDPKSQFFMSQFLKNNKEEKNIIKEIGCRHLNATNIHLSFRCNICNVYFSKSALIGNPINCKKCRKNICFYCHLDEMTSEQIMKFIPELQNIKRKMPKNSKIVRSTENVPEFGAYLDLQSKERVVKYFVAHTFEGKKYLFEDKKSVKNQRQMKIHLLKKIDKPQQEFLRQSLIFTSLEMKKLIPNISKDRALFQYIIPDYLYTCERNKKNSISLVGEKINENFIKNLQEVAQWVFAKKINFSQNLFSNLRIFIDDFPNIQILFLKKNTIHDIQLPKKLFWQKLKYLDLELNSIQIIPDSFCQLKNLQVLILNQNYIKILPIQLTKMNSLKRLKLGINQIQQIPEWLGSMVSLKQLDICCNKIQNLPQIFASLVNLQELLINQNNLMFLPQSLCSLSNLKYLYIYKNKIEVLPENFGNLKKLQKLYAQQNLLKQLPKTLGELCSLQKAFFDNNLLESLPENIGQLTNIQKLFFKHNKLKSIPDNFCQLNNLKELVIGHNCIENIPENFGKLLRLQKLILHNNKISCLPESFGDLESLKSLQLVENQIKTLPNSFGNLIKLEKLFINKNQIIQLPLSLQKLENLKELYLKSNKLQQFPQSILTLESLENLNISDNSVSKIPEEISALKQLRLIYLSQNNLTKLPENMTQLNNLIQLDINQLNIGQLPQELGNMSNLKAIYASQANLKFLPQSIGKLTLLQKLYIEQNQLHQLPLSICNLKNLSELGMRSNQIRYLPQQIWKLSNLRVLVASNNQLKNLPQYFSNLIYLQCVYLQQNSLEQLPNNFQQMQNLTVITLHENLLRTLPKGFGNFPNLQVLYLNNNKLKDLKDELFNCPLMHTLQLNNNQLINIPQKIGNAKQLTTLFLNENQINILPEQIYELKKLKVIHLSDNPLTTLSESIKNWDNLLQIHLSNTQLQILPSTFSELKQLQILDLSYTKISSQNLEIIGKLRKVQNLELNGLNLMHIPQFISQLPLKILHISCNQISKIQPQFAFKNSLQILVMGYNKLEQIPKCLGKIPVLKVIILQNNKIKSFGSFQENEYQMLAVLRLDNNQIRQLPKNLNNLQKLQILSLNENPIVTINKDCEKLLQKGIKFQLDQNNLDEQSRVLVSNYI